LNTQQAKEILLLFRSGSVDDGDPQMVEALRLAEQDQALGQWFEKHRAFQEQMRGKLRQLQPPAHLKAALLRERHIIRPAIWWQQPPVWLGTAAAAAVLVLAAIVVPMRSKTLNTLANFEGRMVSTALREYRMDLETDNMRQLREFIANRGAPADYEVTPGLSKLKLTGGGLLKWRNNPVAMVCFDRGDKQMLFLFVTRKAAVKNPPPGKPQVQVQKYADTLSVSWTSGANTYVLAGPDEPDFMRKYL
jgi:hypothetical protein